MPEIKSNIPEGFLQDGDEKLIAIIEGLIQSQFDLAEKLGEEITQEQAVANIEQIINLLKKEKESE